MKGRPTSSSTSTASRASAGSLDASRLSRARSSRRRATTRIVMNGDGLSGRSAQGRAQHHPALLKSIHRDARRLEASARQSASAGRSRAARWTVRRLKQDHPPTATTRSAYGCGSMIGNIRDMLTFEGLAYAIYDYPEMVEDMVETALRAGRGLPGPGARRRSTSTMPAGWEDICFKNGPIVSVDFFNNVVVPRYKRIGDKLHAARHRPVVHRLRRRRAADPARLPGSRHQLPVPVRGERLRASRRAAGPVRQGSADHGRRGQDRAGQGPGRRSRAYLESLVPLVERGGYIPFCDHRCPPNVKPEDYLYYLDLKEQMFGQPRGAAKPPPKRRPAGGRKK